MYRYRVAVPLRLPKEPDGLLDYLSPVPLERGTPVAVSVRHHQTLGVVWSDASSPPHLANTPQTPIDALKTIDTAWPLAQLSEKECLFIEQVSRYYHQPLGCMLSLAFPPDALRYLAKPPRQRRTTALPAITVSSDAVKASETPENSAPSEPAALTLTASQRKSIETITALQGFQVHLIHGITGSGKTELYRTLAERTLNQGLQVLWLVPEIKLTPQLLQHLAPAWSDRLVALHSHLTPAQRFAAWHRAIQGEADLIIGTRLAIFTPLPRLGLIIVDEEHDGSFSQSDNLRYHARDVAVWRAKYFNCPVILGSATPSLESYINATERSLYHYHALNERAIPGAQLPSLQLTPRVAPSQNPDETPWSDLMDRAISLRLEKGEQSLIFLNRRGYAPALHCVSCGWSAQCTQCSARLVWHKEDRRLRCHHCGVQQQVPSRCPSCGHPDIFPMGLGSQRLEEALKARFSAARILRVDQDSMSKKKAWETALHAISSGDVDILVGTQMLAKGHHFPRLTLVGILGADDALFSADFRSSEHLFAQLMQVAGRAGRAQQAGEVLIETQYPDHPLFRSLLEQCYEKAAQGWIEERRSNGLPPFGYWALLWAESRHIPKVREWIRTLHTTAQSLMAQKQLLCTLTPPMPALMEKRAGWHRYYCMFQSAERTHLHHLLREIEATLSRQPDNRAIKWRIDVDPQSF